MLNRMLLLICLLLPGWSWAVDMGALYRVEEASGISASEAQRQAMELVVYRLTGNTEAASNPVIAAALEQAQNYVASTGYTPAASNRQAGVSFNPEQIDALLLQANLPVWREPRPQVVFWLSQASAAELVSDDPSTPWPALVRSQGAQLALPLLFPLMDLEDSMQVTPQAVTEELLPSILKASQRYGAEALVLGRLYEKEGHWNLDWSLYDAQGQGAALGRGRAAGEPAQLVAQLTAGLMAYFADTYTGGAAIRGPDDGQVLQLIMDGVSRVEDLLAVQGRLQQLPQLKDLRVTSMQGDRVVFAATLEGDGASVLQALRLDSHFQPVPGNGAALHYQWLAN